MSEVYTEVAGDANTVGALALPGTNVPPVSGAKNPFVRLVRLVNEATPGFVDEWVANNPPSGEIARLRSDPLDANTAGVAGMDVVP